MSPRQQDRLNMNLSAILKAGDPATDDREPDRQEMATWRQRMLTEAHRSSPPRRPRRLLVPAAASLIAAALAMALLIHLLRPSANETVHTEPLKSQISQAQPEEQSVSPTTGDTPSLADSGAGTDPVSLLAEAEPATEPGPARDIGTQSAPPPPTPAAPAPLVAAAQRTIHFTAPGGTRVIWTLNAQLNIPSPGGAL